MPIYFPIVMYGDGVCCCLHVKYIVYNTREDNGPHKCLGVCKVSHMYLLGCLRYLEKHKFIVSLAVGVCLFVVYS